MIFFSLDPIAPPTASPPAAPVLRVYFCPRAQDRDDLVEVIEKHGFRVRSFVRRVQAGGVVVEVHVVVVRGNSAGAAARALP